MFKNKHVIVAVIVAPILAIISYMGVDRLVSEKPHVAKQDTSYPLAVKSGCRYASGECRLENGDVIITLKPNVTMQHDNSIVLIASLPIKGAKIALISNDEDAEPVSFSPKDQQQLVWSAKVPKIDYESSQFRIVVFSKESVFFAEIDTVFMQPPEKKMQR